jgi:hypothetical protein
MAVPSTKDVRKQDLHKLMVKGEMVQQQGTVLLVSKTQTRDLGICLTGIKLNTYTKPIKECS